METYFWRFPEITWTVEKERKGKKQALPQNLSKSVEVGPQIVFFQTIITALSYCLGKGGVLVQKNFNSIFAIFFFFCYGSMMSFVTEER